MVVSFKPADGGGYLAYVDGERLGWVRKVGDRWAATDTYMVPAGAAHRTRRRAVAMLLARRKREAA